MLNSIFDSKKNASWTLPEGLLSASCNINKKFGAYVGLQVGAKFPSKSKGTPSFVEFLPESPKMCFKTPPRPPSDHPKSQKIEPKSAPQIFQNVCKLEELLCLQNDRCDIGSE